MTQPILVDPGTISVHPTPYVSNSLFLLCPKPLPHLCCPSRQSSSRDWGVIRDFPTGLHLSPPRSRNRMSYYFIYSQFFLYKLLCTPNTLTSFPLVNVPYFSVENFPCPPFVVGVGNYYSVTSSCSDWTKSGEQQDLPKIFLI